MTHARLLILLISLICTTSLKAQIKEFNIEKALEALFALPENDLNYNELFERYLLLYENPIALNEATQMELKDLHVLSNLEIAQILNYRDSIGGLTTLYELAYVEGIDLEKIRQLSPFLRVGLSSSSQKKWSQLLLSHQNAYLIMRLERRFEKSKGFLQSPSAFAGDRNKLYVRYLNAVRNQYSVGITTEKDAGEAITFDRASSRYGMDFWSIHFMLHNQKKFKRIIVGDYQLQFGQGLIFNSGLGIGKGAETVNTVERVFNGIRPYTSVIEGGFLRGAAATYSLNDRLSTTAFFSSNQQDASLRSNEDEVEVFSTFQITGLHRTRREILRKHNVSERVIGFNIHYQKENLNQFGLTWQSSTFSQPIDRGADPRSIFEFQGRQNMNLSFYLNKNIRQFRLFGESGISSSKGFGTVVGVEGKLDPRLQAVLLLRTYDKDFHSLRGSAFGEGSRNINESGVYLGLTYTLNSTFNIQAYYDRFRNHWISFRIQRPAKGYDYLIRLNYQPTYYSRLYFQYRFKEKDRNVRIGQELYPLPGRSSRYILHLDLESSSSLSFRSKVQWSEYTLNGLRTTGLAFFQDVQLNLNKFRLSGRFSVFDTDGGDNRQYAYERDVRFAFSIPGLSGRGIRNFIMLQYTASHSIDLWIKLSRTTYFDRDKIGIGLDQLYGNQVTDFKFQTLIKF